MTDYGLQILDRGDRIIDDRLRMMDYGWGNRMGRKISVIGGIGYIGKSAESDGSDKLDISEGDWGDGDS